MSRCCPVSNCHDWLPDKFASFSHSSPSVMFTVHTACFCLCRVNRNDANRTRTWSFRKYSFPVRFHAGDVNIRHVRYASSVPMMYTVHDNFGSA